MAYVANKNKNHDVSFYAETPDLDIDAIIENNSVEYHYNNRKMTVKDARTYYSPDEIREITKSYNQEHVNKIQTDEAKSAKKRIARETRKRVFETILAIITIMGAGVFFGLLLYPQAELSEMSRDNSDLKDEISALKKEILDAEEDSNGIADMDSIRAQAIAMGMQEPNANQVIILPMPGDDRLVTTISADAYGINEDALNTANTNLSNYYHSHSGEQ